jgi:hypothetical protein
MNHAPDRSSAVVRPSNWIPAKGGPVETVMHVDPGIVPAQAHDRGFGLSQGYVESGTAAGAANDLGSALPMILAWTD